MRARLRELTRWNIREWKRHDGAITRLSRGARVSR
jgi:hypothetical protein